MQHLIGNFSTLQSVLKGNPKIYDEAKKGIIELDKVIIDDNQKRVDALKKTQDAFDGVTKSVKALTESIVSLQTEEKKLYNAQAQQRI